MDVPEITSKLTEIFAGFTYVKARVVKRIQEQEYEPYEIAFEQGMIVPAEEKDEALSVLTEDLDSLIVIEFRNRGIELDPESLNAEDTDENDDP